MKKKINEEIFNKKIFNKPLRFINRELSWLKFNERVLSESQNSDNPLMEKIRFLSISGNNLDEFHMVRVAGLWRQIKEKVFNRTDDGLTTRQQFNEVSKTLKLLLKKQQLSWDALKKELGSAKINFLETIGGFKENKKEIQVIFKKKILMLLTQEAVKDMKEKYLSQERV